MNLKLIRKNFRQDGIFGELHDETGNLFCVTLEHSYIDVQNKFVPKVPVGLYECVRGPHRLDGMAKDFETFEVTNVQGHTNILIHTGNFGIDSHGCILVGEAIAPDGAEEMITNSKATFAKFMTLQNGIDSFFLEVENMPEED